MTTMGLPEALAWAKQNCAPFMPGADGYAEATQVSPFYGASDTDLTAPADRTAPLLSLINTFLTECLVTDPARPNRCDEFTTSVTTDVDFSNYMSSVVGSQGAGFGLAIVVIIVWLPLWISRCMPHKCCKPQSGAHTSKQRSMAAGCCSFWWLLIFILTMAGLGSGTGASIGTYYTLCASIGMVNSSRNFVLGIGEEVTKLNTSLAATSTALSGLGTDLTTLKASFGASSGAVFTSCAQIAASQATITALDADVLSVSGTSATAQSPGLASAKTALASADSNLCQQRATYFGSLDSAAGGVTTGLAALDMVSVAIDLMGGAINMAANVLGDLLAEFISAVQQAWLVIPSAFGALTFLFALPLILLLLGTCLGSCCLACAKPREISTQEERKCCHKCGTCFTMFTCCGFSVHVVPMFIYCSVLLMVATVATDMGTLLLYVPREPAAAFPTACGVLELQVGGNNISGCGVLAGCFATPSKDLFSSLAPALGLSNGVDLGAVDTNMISATPIDSSTVTSMISSAGTVSLPAGISATTFGIPSSHALYQTVNDHLSSLTTSVGLITPPLSGLGSEVDAVSTGVTATLTSVSGIVSSAQAFMATANQTFSCEWVRDSWDGTIKPGLRGVTVTGLGGLALMLQVTGILGFVLIAMIILMQIRFGGAGRPYERNQGQVYPKA